MENQYGIAVKNKYDLFLNEDEDPFDILKAAEEAQKAAAEDKKKKDAKNEKAKSAKKSSKKGLTPVALESKSKPVDQNVSKKDDRPPRSGKPLSRDQADRDKSTRPLRDGGNRDGPIRRERIERTERPPSSDFRDRGERMDRGEGREFRGRGRGRGRGEGRGRGGRGGRGREFDRQSGSDKTGIKPIDKREGGGAHNWGSVKDDIDDPLNDTNVSTEDNQDWAGQTEETENLDPNTSTEKVEGEEAAPEDESVKELTLDEWKAMQNKERVQPVYNLRKAGEGVDGGQWKKTYELPRKPIMDSDEEEESEEEEEEEEVHGRPKKFVPIEITFYDNPRRGGRGGRRGGRGGRGGGERERGDREGEQERGGFGSRGGRDREGGIREGGFGRGRGGGRGRGDRGPQERRGGFGDRGGGGLQERRGGFGRKEAVPNPDNEDDFPSLSKPVSS